MTSIRHKLWSLNLALLLLLALVLPIGAQTAPAVPRDAVTGTLTGGTMDEALAAHLAGEERPFSFDDGIGLMEEEEEAPYQISVDGTRFYSDTNAAGAGWSYNGQCHRLVLEDYNGGPIRASGDLHVYADGDIVIRGTDSTQYNGGDAIEVSDHLYLYALSGTLQIIGGNGAKGGCGINSLYAYVYNYNDATTIRGGTAYAEGTMGGDGLFVGLTQLRGSNLTIEGGYSTQYLGGCGINSIYLYASGNCTIRGGKGVHENCGVFIAEGGEGYLDYYYIDIYGNPAILLYRSESGENNAVCYLRHVDLTENEDRTHVHIEPAAYRFLVMGNGGKTPIGATFTNLVNKYPTYYAMDSFGFQMEGHTQTGWTINDEFYSLDTKYCPTRNTVATAMWLPVAPGDIVLNGFNGTFPDGKIYQQTNGESVTLPEELDYNSQIVGWRAAAALDVQEDYTIPGLWYASGTEMAPDPDSATVLYAQYVNNGQYAAYHTTLGTSADGGNLIVSGSPVSSSNLTVYAPDSSCVTAPENYIFLGWSTEPDGEVEYEAGDAVVLQTRTVLHLYAIWLPTVASYPLSNGMTVTINQKTRSYAFTGESDDDYTGAAVYDIEGKLIMLDFAPVENRQINLSLDLSQLDPDKLGSVRLFKLDQDYTPNADCLPVPLS